MKRRQKKTTLLTLLSKLFLLHRNNLPKVTVFICRSVIHLFFIHLEVLLMLLLNAEVLKSPSRNATWPPPHGKLGQINRLHARFWPLHVTSLLLWKWSHIKIAGAGVKVFMSMGLGDVRGFLNWASLQWLWKEVRLRERVGYKRVFFHGTTSSLT